MKLSAIIPVYNEASSIGFVLEEALDVLGKMSLEFEVIVINDGSTDSTKDVLQEFAKNNPELRTVTFEKNRGKDAALYTGFRSASGDVIITMDGDGQVDFNDVPRMLPLLQSHDGVFGHRKKREDPRSKKIATRIAYHLRKAILDDTVIDTACPLKIMKKETINCIIPINGFHRFIPFLFIQAGFTYAQFDVKHRKRHSGQPKYRLRSFFFMPGFIDLLFMWWYKKNNLLKKAVGEKHP